MPTSVIRQLGVIKQGEEMRAAVEAVRQAGETVGFVPTMGALHEGHLSLIDAARAQCDRVASSIFVNPTQFGPLEDYGKYPRPMERDLELLQQRGCDLAFVPESAAMYPHGFCTSIDVGEVARPYEGAARPGHFQGVATVVLKLFQLVPANRAYFGEKDYQQLLVVRRMVEDLNVPIEIVGCPTVRDVDGMALSSRNAYLSADERRRARGLSESLRIAQELFASGQRNSAALRTAMAAHLAKIGGVETEYIAIVRDGTVDEAAVIDGPARILIAARVGVTRLIDNLRLA
jgi:pantoate--beta-alanine ligase